MPARQKKGGADRGRSASITYVHVGKDGSEDVREQNCISSNQVLYFSAFVRLHRLIEEADFNSSISNKLVCSMETACSVFKLPIHSSHTQDLFLPRFYQGENKADWELSILFY